MYNLEVDEWCLELNADILDDKMQCDLISVKKCSSWMFHDTVDLVPLWPAPLALLRFRAKAVVGFRWRR
ncbi:hypothetical protein LINPERHAP2_LOCUS32127 [Linum perenne]